MATSLRSTRSGRASKTHIPAELVKVSDSPGKEAKTPVGVSRVKGRSPKRAPSPEGEVANTEATGIKTRRGNARDGGALNNSSSPTVTGKTTVDQTENTDTAISTPSSAKDETTVKDNIEKSPNMTSPSQKASSGKKGTPTVTTPSSAIRRSGRAPVPSSRFKDMEVEIGPGKKRSSTNITSEDPISEVEPVKKKSRKLSERSQQSVESEKSNSKAPENKNTEKPNTGQSGSSVGRSENEKVALSIEEMIQNNLKEAELPKQNDKESTTIKEVRLSDSEEQDAKMETVASDHIETTVIESAVQETTTSASVAPTISIGGQHLTFTQRDGETVAIVTIPPSVSKITAEKPDTEESATQEHYAPSDSVVTEQDDQKDNGSVVSVTPGIHSHGHVVSKSTDNLDQTFAAVVGQDGSAYLNLSVEPTSISSILKGKHLAKANPSQGHGRVIKYTHGSMIVKTTLVPPTKTEEIVHTQQSSEAKPALTYSLLYPKQKPKESESLQPGESTTISLPGSIKQSQPNQTAQRIVVVRQQPSQKAAASSASTLIGIQQAKPAPTVIRFAEELPSKKHLATVVTVQATTTKPMDTKGTTPKTALEIVSQKHKEQQKRVIIKESVHAVDSVVKDSQTLDAEGIEIASDAVQIEQNNEANQSADDNSEQQTDIYSQKSQETDGAGKESTEMPQQEILHAAENVSSNTSFSGVVQLVIDDSAAQNVSQSKASNITDTSAQGSDATESAGGTQEPSQEENMPENTTYQVEAVEAPTTQSTLTELKNVDPSAVKTDPTTSDEQVTTELGPVEQDIDTTVDSSKEVMQNGASASVEKEKYLEKVQVLEGGQELDVRIVSEEEVTEEIIESSAPQTQTEGKDVGNTAEVEQSIVIKQENGDEEDLKQELGKQTSGTQTVYSPRLTDLGNRNQPKLATVVDAGIEKKHIYYVSVIPSKSIVTKSKTNMSLYSGATNWIVDDNGMFCCEKCDYQTDRKANFYKHRRSHSGAKPHVCSVCGYKAGTSSNLKRHMGIHKDIREHKCDICGLCFRQKIHLERHIKYKHEEKSIKCPMCDYICANEQPDLKMHIKRRHSTENMGEVLSCPECKVEVGNKRDLKQHMKFHKDGPELKLFCKECSFVTDCQSRLKRHTAIHSKQKPFQCGVCNYRAAQKEHVLRHLRTQHKIDVKKEKKRPWKRHKKLDTEENSKERADFTSGDKIFACNHCTMRFAKLINLYKHLHTQHSDIMPAETEGNYYCVVCEYSTSSKKNLLVHMRRHNMADQTPPTHVYSCVLCRYVNPRRRNLFQHMRKKHNIVISRPSENGEDDGESQDMEVSDVISSVSGTVAPSTSQGRAATEAVDVKEASGDLAGVANMIKIEDLTRSSTSGEAVDMQTLVIDSRDAGVSTAHADALEGLQALAEQAGLIDNIIEEQVPVLDEQPTIVIDQSGDRTEIVGTVETSEQIQQIIQSEEAVVGSSSDTTQGVELTEDQLSSLRTGDMVEMDGELYMVEMTRDPSNPNKQMLSFLPVTTQQISQES